METTESKSEKRQYCGRRRPRAVWIILGIIGFTAFAFLFGAVVMWLWNSLMPVVFHLGVITYWQAVGLAILGRLLFGGFHHGMHGRGRHNMGPWMNRNRMHDRNGCRDYASRSKWAYYEQYWNEEGDQAFNEYIKRKTGTEGKE
jgi:hypothetical protein